MYKKSAKFDKLWQLMVIFLLFSSFEFNTFPIFVFKNVITFCSSRALKTDDYIAKDYSSKSVTIHLYHIDNINQC